MTRKTFLTIVSFVAMSIGMLALTAPGTLIESVKHAPASDTANVMARTVGILLVTVGLLNFLVRGHEDSPTMKAILMANLFLQIGIMPIDPLAYVNGIYATLGSFVPNTVLHLLLASGFGYYLVAMKLKRSRVTALGTQFGDWERSGTPPTPVVKISSEHVEHDEALGEVLPPGR